MNNCISKKIPKPFTKTAIQSAGFCPGLQQNRCFVWSVKYSPCEDTGLDIPKILSVSVEDGQWVITSEYAKGVTLTQLIKEHPENIDSYVHAMVDYQIAFNKRSNPLLLKLKDKLVRQLMNWNWIPTLNMSCLPGWNRCQSTISSATATTARTISLLKRTMPERLPLSLPLTGFMPHRAMPVPMLPTHI